jgi:hypothetical protein
MKPINTHSSKRSTPSRACKKRLIKEESKELSTACNEGSPSILERVKMQMPEEKLINPFECDILEPVSMITPRVEPSSSKRVPPQKTCITYKGDSFNYLPPF